MEEINIPKIIDMVSQLIASLTIIATILSRLMHKKEAAVGKIAGKVLKALKYMPTIGINPNTKKLEKQLEEIQK